MTCHTSLLCYLLLHRCLPFRSVCAAHCLTIVKWIALQYYANLLIARISLLLVCNRLFALRCAACHACLPRSRHLASAVTILRFSIFVADRHYCLYRCCFLFRFVVWIADLHCALQLCVLRFGQRRYVCYVLGDDHLVLSLEKDLVLLCLLAHAHDEACLQSLLQRSPARVAVEATRRSKDEDAPQMQRLLRQNLDRRRSLFVYSRWTPVQDVDGVLHRFAPELQRQRASFRTFRCILSALPFDAWLHASDTWRATSVCLQNKSTLAYPFSTDVRSHHVSLETKKLLKVDEKCLNCFATASFVRARNTRQHIDLWSMKLVLL